MVMQTFDVNSLLTVCYRLHGFSEEETKIYLMLNNIVTSKSRFEVTQVHSNWCHSKTWVQFPIRLP